ncbi:hypothetical protein [Rhodococcus daqingensis]|uniref:Ferredoxin n=1 Tax=Rhodococcus daqingensis TaxID=2479363 RepID=A0ABW2RYS0_9NOCA
MEPVDCERCGIRVLVEKSSWEHTSVQWNTDHPEAICEEYQQDPSLTQRGARIGRCSALRESIRKAVLDGRIPVPE